MYFEDVDLGFRLGKRGFRNVYDPSAEVTHSGAHATGRDGAAMIRAHHESARRFLDAQVPGAACSGRCASSLAIGLAHPLRRHHPPPRAAGPRRRVTGQEIRPGRVRLGLAP